LHGAFGSAVGDDLEGAFFVDVLENKLLKKYIIIISGLCGLQNDFTVEDPLQAALEWEGLLGIKGWKVERYLNNLGDLISMRRFDCGWRAERFV
jgi:hypothetical protein